MKLSANCIAEILQQSRRGVSQRELAARFGIRRYLVQQTIKHRRAFQFRIKKAIALEIPGTRPGQWRCPACGQFLEFAPCVKCGEALAPPREVGLFTPPAANVGAVREVNSVSVL